MELIESFLTLNPCYQANLTQADNRYVTFQISGPKGLMLHSVGCNQPKAEIFVRGWNKADYDRACVHAFIDADTGVVWQTLPWNYRGWHCGGFGNDTLAGVEMCESKHINYINGYQFTVSDLEAARADCTRAYIAAAELFAYLCNRYKLNPMTAIFSHKEGSVKGIASDHGDPESYWSGLGMGYTMDAFRNNVKALMGEVTEPEIPIVGYLGFPDVEEGDWYASALRWAVEKKVVLQSGKPFNPDAPLTKATAVVLLRRLWNAVMEEPRGE